MLRELMGNRLRGGAATKDEAKEKAMVSLKRKVVSLCCAVTLATSLVPTPAMAEESSKGGGSSYDVSLQGEVVQLIGPVRVDAETTVEALFDAMPLSLESVGPAPLKATNQVDWIDRVDFNGHQSAREFYDALVEATDNDGISDYLIKDKYLAGSASSENASKTGGYINQEIGQGDQKTRLNCLVIGPIAYDGSFEDAFYRELVYAQAALAAFDRDHPEVFWLAGGGSFQAWGSGSSLYLGFEINDGCLSGSYATQAEIEAAVKKRDADVERILGKVSSADTAVAKMTAFDSELTKTNAYNSSSDLEALQGRYPDAWECVSALEGRAGARGPVCEGYARAFKVLCDQAKIPCVLVDGEAKTSLSAEGEGHMWNYAQADNGLWYAVDVTWNDPGKANTAQSGSENTDWLLVGADTIVGGVKFIESHPVTNKFFLDRQIQGGPMIYQTAFPNGPTLSPRSYEDRLLYDSSDIAATYGDVLNSVPLDGIRTTTAKSGQEVSGLWEWVGGTEILKSTGMVEREAIFTPYGAAGETVRVPIKVEKKLLSVKPGIVASKTYDGTVQAFFSTAPQLQGVIAGDDVKLIAKASFADASVGNGKKVSIAYSLSGTHAANYQLSQVSASATANVTQAPKPETPSTPSQPSKPSTPSTGTTKPAAPTPAPAPKPSAPSTPAAKPATPSTPAAKPSTPSAPAKPAVKAPTFKKTKVSKAKSSKKKTLTITWKKAAKNPVKYQIQCATDKKFKKGLKKATVKVTKKLAKRKSLSVTVKKLKSKKTYYVRVRAQYKVAGKTYYGPWATYSKKVKVK